MYTIFSSSLTVFRCTFNANFPLQLYVYVLPPHAVYFRHQATIPY